MNAETMLTAGLIFGSIWAIICRVRYMDPKRTRSVVFIQHAALAMGLFCALMLPSPHSKLGLVTGVFVFLVLGANRWRHGAPPGTEKPMYELELSALQKAAGGVKHD